MLRPGCTPPRPDAAPAPRAGRATAIADQYRRWLEPLESFALVSGDVEPIADRVRLRYRFRGWDPVKGWQENEHTAYAAVVDGRVETLNTLVRAASGRRSRRAERNRNLGKRPPGSRGGLRTAASIPPVPVAWSRFPQGCTRTSARCSRLAESPGSTASGRDVGGCRPRRERGGDDRDGVGKSLAFSLPVLDAIARDRTARAIFLYPTKALTQDQARWLAALELRGLRPRSTTATRL